MYGWVDKKHCILLKAIQTEKGQVRFNVQRCKLMKLRKDDPVYYKAKINKLIREAKENNLDVFVTRTLYAGVYLNFKSKETDELASVKIED